jgi:hypothetical protein
MSSRLDDVVKEAVDRFRNRAAALDGPQDVEGFFHDTEDYSAFDLDSEMNDDRFSSRALRLLSTSPPWSSWTTSA